MLNQVTESLVFYYHDALMTFGSRYTGSPNCSRAAEYLYEKFSQMGLDTQLLPWNYGGFRSQNVVATLNGTDRSDDTTVIICAHYDTTEGSLGANDDGSGVAAVLASAAIMSQYSFRHTIKFILFSGEEVGTYGSFTYAKEAYEKGENILAVLNFDMIGYANSAKGGKLMRVFQTDRSKWISSFSINVSKTYYDILDISIQPIPNYRGADHQAFIDYGYDAVFYAHYDSYPWGNSPDDTPDHINHSYQVKATKLILAIVGEMANKPIPIRAILKSPLEGYCYISDYPVFPLSLGRLWYSDLRGTTLIVGRSTVRVDVKSTSAVQYVVFCLDDIFISWDRAFPYEWKIQGKYVPALGEHRLKIFAYDDLGNVASDEMDIFVFTLSYQYAPWNN
jgi:hypothetical protein